MRDQPRYEHKDSAGVRIVESHRALWVDDDGWTIEAVPMIDLARTTQDGNHLFSRVREMILLGDGSIVVADGGSQELRLYDPDGQWQNTTGGPGEGPGEFENLQQIVLIEENVWALDYDGRIAIFDRDLTLVRTLRLPNSAEAIYDFAAGEILVELGYLSMAFHQGGRALIREPSTLWRYDLLGTNVDSVGKIAGYEEYMFVVEGGPSGAARPLFGKSSQVDTRNGSVFAGDSDAMEIEEWTATGEVVRIMRIPNYPLELTADAIAAERQARLGDDPHPLVVQIEEQLPSPATRPAYDEMIVDPMGAVWLRRFRGESERGGPETWEVLDGDGSWLGSVQAPPRVRIMDVEVDAVVGVWWDELAVEHPSKFALRR